MKTATNENIIKQFYPLLWYISLNLTNNQDNASDLVQDTCEKILKAPPPHSKNIKAWVTTIIRNQFINDYRRHRPGSVVYIPEYTTPMLESTQTDSTMLVEELMQVVIDLPKCLKTPLLMYMAGYSYKEIAKELNIPMNTVKSSIHRARAVIKTKL